MHEIQFGGRRRQVILYVWTFKDVSQHRSFLQLSAVFLFGWDFVCFMFVWLFTLCLSFGFKKFSREFKKTTKATAMETRPWLCMCVIILNSFFYRPKQNGNVK